MGGVRVTGWVTVFAVRIGLGTVELETIPREPVPGTISCLIAKPRVKAGFNGR